MSSWGAKIRIAKLRRNHYMTHKKLNRRIDNQESEAKYQKELKRLGFKPTKA